MKSRHFTYLNPLSSHILKTPAHVQSDILPVLIVGAGPAGLFCALSLAQNGVKVRILDKADRFYVGSRGYGVQANGACLSRDYLEGILRGHLAKYGVKVELGQGLVAIEQRDDLVKAGISPFQAGQATGDTKIIEAQYLVGADGARGASRELLGLTFQGKLTMQTVWFGTM
ncbi:hypothetical protein V5O48_012321 [Marasmius crinis-equi]|uniref:FAD-binding domain-containing protein n=1 Tax=Marasmius crinis-equi TaxID=585013 RepID=A0ABR3F337_9AGAR